MDPEKEYFIQKEIMGIYSWNLFTRIYTILRLKLSPLIQLEKYVPKEGNILDLGCGAGIFANILRLGSNKRSILGVDLSSKRIATAEKSLVGNPQMKFVAGDVNSVYFGEFRIITLIDLLHHMPFSAQNQLLEKVYNKLGAGGVLLIKDLEKTPFWKYVFHYIQDSISYKGKRLFFRGRGEMVRLLDDMGFQTETISLAAGFPHPHILYRCTKE